LPSRLNVADARMADARPDEMDRPDARKPRFVAGSIGPTDKKASLSRSSLATPDLARSRSDEPSRAIPGKVEGLSREGSNSSSQRRSRHHEPQGVL